MINLFFVTHDFSGVRTYTDELLGFLKEQPDIKIYCVYTVNVDYKEYTESETDGILKLYIPEVKRKGSNNLSKYAARCMDLLAHHIDGKKNVIFHLNNSIQIRLGLEARKRYGASLIYTLHFLPNYFSCAEVDGVMPEDLSTTGDVLEKEMIREADRVICVTRFAQKTIIKYYGCPEIKTIVIYNGCGREPTGLQTEQKKVLKAEFGFREREKILLFVGRIGQGKGIRELIRVFNLLSGKYREARLVVVGDGKYAEALQQVERNWGRITFTGKVSKELLEELYGMATIGIIPSLYEQCSYVALEMMQHGLPVITSAAPGLKELFINRENALILPLYSRKELLELELKEEELFEAMDELLNDVVLQQRLRKHAQIRWQQQHVAANMGEATGAQYRDLLRKCNPQKKKGQKAAL